MECAGSLRKRHGVAMAMMAVLLAASAARAQDVERIVGVWRFVREADVYADGSPVPHAPKAFDGQLIYTADGFVSVNIMPQGRIWHVDTAKPSELRDTLVDGTAYAGRYEIDATTQTVTHLIEVSVEPDYVGRRLQWHYSFKDDTLQLSGSFEQAGKIVHFSIEWERAGTTRSR
jgi:hypothetical protein